MVVLDQMKVEIQNLQETLKEVTASLDLDSKKKIIEELSREMEEPGFWDNAEKANKKTKDLKNMQDLVENIENLNLWYVATLLGSPVCCFACMCHRARTVVLHRQPTRVHTL